MPSPRPLARHAFVELGLSDLGDVLACAVALLGGGGSVWLLPGGRLQATDCVFSRNRAVFGSGGALAARVESGGGEPAVALRRVVFDRNEATWRGGALSLTAVPPVAGPSARSAAGTAAAALVGSTC